MTTARRLANPGRMRGAEIEQSPQGLSLQMRLIAQHDSPVRKTVLPSRPLRRALNGTEHASFGSRVDNPGPGREGKAVKLSLHGLVAGSAHNCDLSGSHGLPLPDQVAQH